MWSIQDKCIDKTDKELQQYCNVYGQTDSMVNVVKHIIIGSNSIVARDESCAKSAYLVKVGINRFILIVRNRTATKLSPPWM